MKYYAGVDLGGTFIKCGIVGEDGTLLIKDKIPTGKERGYGAIAADIARFAQELARRTNVTLTAVGIGSPGMIDSAQGVVVYGNNLNWRNVPLAQEVGSRLNLPTLITNDANAAALGEFFCGAGAGFQTVVLVTLGTGVGGGIVLDGKLYEGGRSAGTEIGHEVIRVGGERCTCGRRGCFEAYASATALIKSTKRAMERHPESALWKLCEGDLERVDGKTAFDGMRLSDPAAKRVVARYERYLAEGLANLANVFRPDAILLGGGVCAEGETLLKPLRKRLNGLLYGGPDYAPVKLLTASLGNDAGIYGAARLAMTRA